MLVVAAGLVVYAALLIWTNIGVDLLGQNLFRANQVELPRLGRPSPVPTAGTSGQETTALILSRAHLPINPDQPASRDVSNVIYPVAGRNGLHFSPDRCTGCGLCVYTCPTQAVTTNDNDRGYVRRFDLTKCVYCGLCESACPTSSIRLTLNPQPNQPTLAVLVVEGEIETLPCRLCGRHAPQTDLLAERIYEPPANGEETDEDEFERLRLTVNPNGVCLECQKRVLEAEERICG